MPTKPHCSLNKILLTRGLPLNDDHRTHCYNHNNTCPLCSYPWFSSSHKHDKESSPHSLLMVFSMLMVRHLWYLPSLICNNMEVLLETSIRFLENTGDYNKMAHCRFSCVDDCKISVAKAG